MSKVRIAIAALTLSAAGFVGILNREGYESVAYPDPVHGTALPTLGFGSTAHNIGPGAFCRSTIVRRLNVGDYPSACEAILLFKRAGKQDCSVPGNRVCPGLWKDRLRLNAKCKGM